MNSLTTVQLLIPVQYCTVPEYLQSSIVIIDRILIPHGTVLYLNNRFQFSSGTGIVEFDWNDQPDTALNQGTKMYQIVVIGVT